MITVTVTESKGRWRHLRRNMALWCLSKLIRKRYICLLSKGLLVVTLRLNPSHTEMFGTPTPFTKGVGPLPVISRTLTLRDLKFCRLLGVLLKRSENVNWTKYLLFCFHGNRLLFKCFCKSFGIIWPKNSPFSKSCRNLNFLDDN